MNILIAPNAFKHALSSFQVAEMIEKGFAKSKLSGIFTIFPIADGGNGTLDLIVHKLGAEIIHKEVSDPLGRKILSRFGYIASSKTAVIEMAEASGIHLLNDEERNPLIASSYGTGELMKHALEMGAKKIILGLGGSASIDGGAGILQALGAKLLDEKGKEVARGGGSLEQLATIDTKDLSQEIKNCEIIVACDVNSPLLGKNGAATVFGPQKGASHKDVIKLERGLKKFSEIIFKDFKSDVANLPAGGAAGGISAGLFGVLNAKLVNGLEYLLDLTKFEKVLKESDLLITAEGKFDMQTIEGKGPFGVAQMAKNNNVPVIVFAGQVSEDINVKKIDAIEAIFSISKGPNSLQEAILNTGDNLKYLAEQVGNIIHMAQTNR